MIYVIKKDGTKEEFNPQKICGSSKVKSASQIFIHSLRRKKILSAVLRRSMRIHWGKMRFRSRKCTIL